MKKSVVPDPRFPLCYSVPQAMHAGKLTLCLSMAAVLAGCGAPGFPQPPSLALARPVRDLRAARKGNEVHLSWTVPAETTDHRSFRHPGDTKICRDVGATIQTGKCEPPLAELSTPATSTAPTSRFRLWKRPVPKPATGPQANYTDQLSPGLELQYPTSNMVYAVVVLNSFGRTAGSSNEVQVPAAPTLASPPDFNAELTAPGVRLTWTAVRPPQVIPAIRYLYRVYRLDVTTGKDSVAAELPLSEDAHPTLLDTGFEWEKTYEYRVTVVTTVEQSGGIESVEGDDSLPARVLAHDVFPPATPTGLQAAFSGPGQKPFIDLVWNANPESDLAGYDVYRRD